MIIPEIYNIVAELYGQKDFDPAKHPRGADGKFTSGGYVTSNLTAKKYGPHAGKEYGNVKEDSPVGQILKSQGWKYKNDHWVNPKLYHVDPITGKFVTAKSAAQTAEDLKKMQYDEAHAGGTLGMVSPQSDQGKELISQGYQFKKGHWVQPNLYHVHPETGKLTPAKQLYAEYDKKQAESQVATSSIGGTKIEQILTGNNGGALQKASLSGVVPPEHQGVAASNYYGAKFAVPGSIKGQLIANEGFTYHPKSDDAVAHWESKEGHAYEVQTGNYMGTYVKPGTNAPVSSSQTLGSLKPKALFEKDSSGNYAFPMANGVTPGTPTAKAFESQGWKYKPATNGIDAHWVNPKGEAYSVSGGGFIGKYSASSGIEIPDVLGLHPTPPSSTSGPKAPHPNTHHLLANTQPDSPNGKALANAGWDFNATNNTWKSPTGKVFDVPTGKAKNNPFSPSSYTPPSYQLAAEKPELSAQADANLANSKHFVGYEQESAAVQYAEDISAQHEAILSPSEISAMQEYTGGSYHSLNEKLRLGKGGLGHLTYSQKQHQAEIDKAMAKATIPHDIIVYRGTGSAIDPASLKPGDTIVDHGNVSTSTHTSGSFGGSVQFRIKIPAGSHGVSVYKFSYHASEKEIVLPRGSKFKILRVSKSSGQPIADVELIS